MTAVGNAGGIWNGECYALDIEDTRVPANADLFAYCLDYLTTIQRPIGIRPYLYSGDWYMAPHNLEGHPELGAFPLWYASYQPTQPNPPAGWDKIAIWQYSATAMVNGIRGLVDLDVLNGTIAYWRANAWGFQPDPLAGQKVYVPDVDRAVDAPTAIKAALARLKLLPESTDRDVAIADLDLSLTKFGLVGA